MRRFNISGVCNPDKHYMVNPFRGLYQEVSNLILAEQYFLIHAPRQSGKTTLLHALAHRLNKEGQFTATVFSVENARYQSISVEAANGSYMTALFETSELFLPPDERPPLPEAFEENRDSLFRYLKAWSLAQKKPVVVLMDEVDSLHDDVLVNLLSQLRNGFQIRPDLFPASVALVGLRDIRDYKLKAKGGNPSLGSGSPFNIKTRSFLLKSFTREEVGDLLAQHEAETGQAFPTEVVDLIFHYSAGQPWLTNALAYEIVYDLLKYDFTLPITPNLVEQAKENLIARRETHLDSLLDKLKEERVLQIVSSIISGDEILFDNYNDGLLYCRDLGIVAPDSPVRFANPIYKEIAVRNMNQAFHDSFNPDIVETAWYLKPDGRLDMDKLLRAFVDFYRYNSESWLERFQFKEAGHQLLIMAFLQRIVNGGGRIDREMAAGRGRTDVTIEWKDEKFVLELKLKHNARSRPSGITQLDRYLDRLGKKEGYLLIFEKKSPDVIPWEERLKWEPETVNGKDIMVIEM